ncbi:MAG: hypothetical protein AAF950_17970 [Pseudomonadota bacterium]
MTMSATSTNLPKPEHEPIVNFGRTLAMSEDGSTLLVAAQKAASPVFGVVYLYRFQNKQWTLSARLQPNLLELRDEDAWVETAESSWRDAFGRPIVGYDFGAALSISKDGSKIAIGAPAAAADHSTIYVGAAYLFVDQKAARGKPDWQLSPPITNDDFDGGQSFGAAVAIDDDNVAFGAPDKAGGGGAYVSRLGHIADLGSSIFAEKVETPSENTQHFGTAVALSSNTLFVSDPGSADAHTGVVHGYRLASTDLEPSIQLSNPDGMGFGRALAMAGNKMLVAGDTASSLVVYDRAENGGWKQDKKADAAVGNGVSNLEVMSIALSKHAIVLGARDGVHVAGNVKGAAGWPGLSKVIGSRQTHAVAAGGELVAYQNARIGKALSDQGGAGDVVVSPLGVLAVAKGERVIRVFNTGVDQDGKVRSPGENDLHYIMTTRTGDHGPAVIVDPDAAWMAPPVGSAWIAPISVYHERKTPQGVYDYTMKIDLRGIDEKSVSLSGEWVTDNTGIILLNGKATGVQHKDRDFTKLRSFSISSGFVKGPNVLLFKVTNGHALHNPSGLLVANLRLVQRTKP